jgi:formylglycine-generating enzyme required for sulfatase activity
MNTTTNLPLPILLSFVIAACGSAKRPEQSQPAATVVPERVAIPRQKVTMGVSLEHRTWKETVDAFEVSKYPVTVQQYDECVAAGACAKADLKIEACGDWLTELPKRAESLASAPMQCVAPEQAASFCKWVDGQLPTSAQWTVAARGAALRRFSWGDDPATCEQHPMTTRGSCASSLATRAVGKHPAGASPLGIEDVLSIGGEFMRVTTDSGWQGCKSGRACVVSGISIGSIDTFTRVGDLGEDGLERLATTPSIAFRCVWENVR